MVFEWFRRIIGAEQPLKEEFHILDPHAMKDDVKAITLTLIPPTGDLQTWDISLYWSNSQQKLFEKKFEEALEADELFEVMKTDLQEVATLTKEQKLDAAKTAFSNMLEKYAIYSDKLVEGDPQPVTTTMAEQEPVMTDKELVDYLKPPSKFALWFHNNIYNYENREVSDLLEDAIQEGFSEQEVMDYLKSVFHVANAELKMIKEAGIVMQNIFFDTPEEAKEYQQKMQELQPEPTPTLDLGEDVIPGEEGEIPTMEEEIGPPSLSYEDAEKQKAEEEKNISKRIEQEVKDQVESALDKKIATMFTEKDKQLVKALRGVGRTWEEIRDYMIKELKYDKEGVAAYLDQMKKEELGVEEPEKEMEAPKPPEELVSPETHDKLLEEVPVEELKEEPKLEEPEVEEIANMEGEIDKKADIQKEALDPLEMPPVMDQDLDFQTQELPGEAPTIEPVNMGEPEVQESFAPGDHVYVMSDYETKDQGFEATYVSEFEHQGDTMVNVESLEGEMLEVPKYLVTKAKLEFKKIVKKADINWKCPNCKNEKFEHEDATFDSSSGMNVITCPDCDYSDTIDKFQVLDEIELEESAKKVTPKFKVGDELRTYTPLKSAEDAYPVEDSVGEFEVVNVLVPEKVYQLLSLHDKQKDYVLIKDLDKAVIDMYWPIDKANPDVKVTDSPIDTTDTYFVEHQSTLDAIKKELSEITKQADLLETDEDDEGIKCDTCGTELDMRTTSDGQPWRWYCANCDKYYAQNLTGSQKKVADPVETPVVQAPIEFKPLQKAPPGAREKMPAPAPEEVLNLYKSIDIIKQNLNIIESAKQQIQAKASQEVAQMEETMGKSKLLADFNTSLEKLAMAAKATGQEVLDVGDQLLSFQEEAKKGTVTLSAAQWLEKIKEKFPAVVSYMEKAANGMQALAKTVMTRKLFLFPKQKMSSKDVEAAPVDSLNEAYSNLVNAFSELADMPELKG